MISNTFVFFSGRATYFAVVLRLLGLFVRPVSAVSLSLGSVGRLSFGLGYGRRLGLGLAAVVPVGGVLMRKLL